jgi:hypothetical protein
MSVKLSISIPDVNAQVAQGFDFVRVFRSTQGPSGPFVEITAAAPRAATLTGTIAGPFNVSGMALMLRANRGPTQTVTLIGENPLSAASIAGLVTAQVAGVVSSDDGGRIVITTTGVGTDEIIEVLGTCDLLPLLGFNIGQFDIGEAARIPIVESVTEYVFEDVAGSDSDYYVIDFINSSTSVTSERSDPVKGLTAQTAPKQQADTRSPRGLTLTRKSSHVFRESFFTDSDGVTPLVPLDASKYPSYQVVDINGQVSAAGLATLDGTAGHYRVEFFTPPDAPISNDDRRWRIEWLFLDDDERQFQKTTEFDVRDADITASAVRDQKLLAMANKPFRVFIRETRRPFSIRLDVTNANSDDQVLVDGAVYPSCGAPGEKLITEVRDNETVVYYFDIGQNLLQPGVTYKAVWSITESIGTAPQYAFQIIEVPHPNVIQFLPSLRMCIDKYQKRKEIVQAYQDSDIYEYLVRGAEIVNSYHPMTGYTVTQMPPVLTPYWLLAAQLWGLNAQHLLETDLQFSFGGQTVTLDYDHTANVEAGIQRATEFLEKLTPVKTALVRRGSPAGVYAGKQMRFSGIHNTTFPIARYGSSDFLSLLSNMGLL